MSCLLINEKKKTFSPRQQLVEQLKLLLNKQHCWNECYTEDIPKHWEKHGDLVLLPPSCFSNKIWNDCTNLWETVAKTLKCKKVARKYSVNADDFRSPQVELLFGDNGWTTCVENGIKYAYDVTKCMFSAGNISEKIRISKFKCIGETVVDMYAGIGYFTLPYLVHAKANVVHACEWNLNAIEALERNLILNKVKDRCIIHCGDCRKVCPLGIADRVNLGLLPTSEFGWETACLALNRNKGGILHIHCNVTSGIEPTGFYSKGMNKEQRENNSGTDQLERKCHDQDKLLTDHQTVKDSNNDDNPVTETKIKKLDVSIQGKEQWRMWGNKTVKRIKELIFENYSVTWNITLLHIQHVKSYAPHIDHLVADIECRP